MVYPTFPKAFGYVASVAPPQKRLSSVSYMTLSALLPDMYSQECFLCPNEGGAFKMTDHGQWVHLLCAMWVPEMTVQNEVYMDPTIAFEDKLMERMKRLVLSI